MTRMIQLNSPSFWESREGERRANQNIFNFSAQLRSLEIVHQMLHRSVVDSINRKTITDNKNRNIKIKLKLKTQLKRFKYYIIIHYKQFTDYTLLVHSFQRVILCRENPNNKTVSQRIPCRLSVSSVPPLPLHLPSQLLQKFQPYQPQ